jgi:hypothetical protein
MNCIPRALVLCCVAVASAAACAADVDADGKPMSSNAPVSSGLRMHAASGPLYGAALVDFALPRPALLGGAGWGAWAQEATALRERLLPSWRLVGSDGAPRSGLRASAGVVNVSRATAFGTSTLAEQAVIATLPLHRLTGMGTPLPTASAPYLGVGWHDTPAVRSGNSASSGGAWGFNADFGLMALAPRSTVRFGRNSGGPLTLDDMARDLRLTPLLQLGVSYSF